MTNLDFFRLVLLKDILLNLVIDKITEVKSPDKHDWSKIFLYLLNRAKLWVTGFTLGMRGIL